MSDNKIEKKQKTISPDWFVSGILTKIGELFDRLTGRNWKPSSSLATSELIIRLKKILDSKVSDLGEKGRFVPHNIRLKMQWNKFSTDAEDSLKKLEYELLAAAIDYINDNRYHTYKPLRIEIKPDYFTEGVKFLASFGEQDEDEAEVNVTAPQLNVKDMIPPEAAAKPKSEIFVAEFNINGRHQSAELHFIEGKRFSVGRTKENDLSIDDASVSKVHATLFLNAEKKLLVADTGSTNGTFINGERIAYGRAFAVGENETLKFGTINVFLRPIPQQTDFAPPEAYQLDDLADENNPPQTSPPENFEVDKSHKDSPIGQQTVKIDRVNDGAANGTIEKNTNEIAEKNGNNGIIEKDNRQGGEKDDTRNKEKAAPTQHLVKLNFDED